MWICTPLPTPSAAGMGEKQARWPSRCAAARAISRVITAWSPAVRAAAGATVTSNCRAPYSARKTVRHHARGPQGGDEGLAERALAAERAQAVRVARPVLIPRIDELLLEGGDQAQATGLGQRGNAAAEELARAALPRGAVGVADIAEEEMLPARTHRRSLPAPRPSHRARSSGRHAVPKGVSKIGPNAVCIRLECVHPIPLRRRASISRAGNPLPRTWPAMSQVATKTSPSRSMASLPDLGRRAATLARRCGDEHLLRPRQSAATKAGAMARRESRNDFCLKRSSLIHAISQRSMIVEHRISTLMHAIQVERQ